MKYITEFRKSAKGNTSEPEKTKPTPSSKRKSLIPQLGFMDFLLFAAACLIKSDFWENNFFDEKYSFLNIFAEDNVLKVYVFSFSGLFVLLKLIAVIFSKNSIKSAGVLIILIQCTTLFLISPIMPGKSELKYQLLLFAGLNLLLYFCFQILVGNIFTNALQKLIALIFCGGILYLSVTALQTITTFNIDLYDFGKEFVNKLRI